MKILIVQKSVVLCQRIINLLEASHRYEAIGLVGKPHNALRLIATDKPDALLLDLHLAGGAAMQLLKDLQAQQLSLPVLLLAESTELAYLQRAQALGVQALLVREGEFEHIVATLDQLLLAGEHAAPAHPLIH
ncbi:MAG: response regulator transcription factor [Sterolibacterium sp.]|jgi:DNA-binding NarL/FixJ family response regulator|nr:response regulator transcription factor [Sterolibacterium sp.]